MAYEFGVANPYGDVSTTSTGGGGGGGVDWNSILGGVLNFGTYVYDDLVYSEQERTRDAQRTALERYYIDRQAAAAANSAQGIGLSSDVLLVGGLALGAVLLVAVMK